jgi:hypothetical protein
MITAILTSIIAAAIQLLRPYTDSEDNDRILPFQPLPSLPTATSGTTTTTTTTSFANIATFVSSMVFAFEGIGLVLPIENSYVGHDQQHESSSSNHNHNSNSQTIHHHQQSKCRTGITPPPLSSLPGGRGSYCS